MRLRVHYVNVRPTPLTSVEAETLPIEIAPIAAAASKLSVTFFIAKSPFFLEKPDHRLLRTRNGRALRLSYK